MRSSVYAAVHAGINDVPPQWLLARCFERKMELIRAVQLLKLNSVSTGKFTFFREHVLQTIAKWFLRLTMCTVLL